MRHFLFLPGAKTAELADLKDLKNLKVKLSTKYN